MIYDRTVWCVFDPYNQPHIVGKAWLFCFCDLLSSIIRIWCQDCYGTESLLFPLYIWLMSSYFEL